MKLETTRLRVHTASQAEMEKIIDSQTDAELKKAYQEMLSLSLVTVLR